jgi:hypothetical protein
MPKIAIAQVAKLIGRELESGAGPSEGALATGPILAETGATNEIAERLFAEAHRKRPNNRMIEAYAFMLEGALGTLRLQANGGDVSAEHAIDEVRNRVDQALARAEVAPGVLILLARAFARAELDPGRSVQQAMVNAMEAQSHSGPTGLSAEELSDHFAELAAALDNDPFAIYAEFASTAAAFPTEHHAAMAGALARSENEAVREAALGFAFSPDRAASSAALVAITQQARSGLVSSKTVDRLVHMRPWVSEMRRANVDTAVRALRPKAAPPLPLERWETRGVLASLCDGAGAQSLFGLTKRGRRFALACLLVKTEIGVADAWVRDGMTRAEADGLITQIVAGAEAVESSIGFLEQRLADALAINVARDVPPPFGLLRVVETLGLGPLHPESATPSVIAESLIAELPPERTDAAAAQRAHRASARWEEKFETIATWFEAGEAVAGLLRPLKTRKRQIEAVLTQLLPARRLFWTERCVWMAATLKEAAIEGDNTWSEFALVARDLGGGKPLDAVPLARQIAAATVDAFEQR